MSTTIVRKLALEMAEQMQSFRSRDVVAEASRRGFSIQKQALNSGLLTLMKCNKLQIVGVTDRGAYWLAKFDPNREPFAQPKTQKDTRTKREKRIDDDQSMYATPALMAHKRMMDAARNSGVLRRFVCG